MAWIKKPRDTGALDISLLAVGMTAGTWTLRREGRTVHMAISDAKFTMESGTLWASYRLIPNGFRPPAVPSYHYFPSSASRALASAAGLRVSRYGDVEIYDIAGKTLSTTCVWITDDAWPASLPGVSI